MGRRRGDEAARSAEPIEIPQHVIKALFVGHFVLQTVLVRRADYWRDKLEATYGLELDMHVADPPFEVDDVECKGYWLKPDAHEYEQRV